MEKKHAGDSKGWMRQKRKRRQQEKRRPLRTQEVCLRSKQTHELQGNTQREKNAWFQTDKQADRTVTVQNKQSGVKRLCVITYVDKDGEREGGTDGKQNERLDKVDHNLCQNLYSTQKHTEGKTVQETHVSI